MLLRRCPHMTRLVGPSTCAVLCRGFAHLICADRTLLTCDAIPLAPSVSPLQVAPLKKKAGPIAFDPDKSQSRRLAFFLSVSEAVAKQIFSSSQLHAACGIARGLGASMETPSECGAAVLRLPLNKLLSRLDDEGLDAVESSLDGLSGGIRQWLGSYSSALEGLVALWDVRVRAARCIADPRASGRLGDDVLLPLLNVVQDATHGWQVCFGAFVECGTVKAAPPLSKYPVLPAPPEEAGRASAGPSTRHEERPPGIETLPVAPPLPVVARVSSASLVRALPSYCAPLRAVVRCAIEDARFSPEFDAGTTSPQRQEMLGMAQFLKQLEADASSRTMWIVDSPFGATSSALLFTLLDRCCQRDAPCGIPNDVNDASLELIDLEAFLFDTVFATMFVTVLPPSVKSLQPAIDAIDESLAARFDARVPEYDVFRLARFLSTVEFVSVSSIMISAIVTSGIVSKSILHILYSAPHLFQWSTVDSRTAPLKHLVADDTWRALVGGDEAALVRSPVVLDARLVTAGVLQDPRLPTVKIEEASADPPSTDPPSTDPPSTVLMGTFVHCGDSAAEGTKVLSSGGVVALLLAACSPRRGACYRVTMPAGASLLTWVPSVSASAPQPLGDNAAAPLVRFGAVRYMLPQAETLNVTSGYQTIPFHDDEERIAKELKIIQRGKRIVDIGDFASYLAAEGAYYINTPKAYRGPAALTYKHKLIHSLVRLKYPEGNVFFDRRVLAQYIFDLLPKNGVVSEEVLRSSYFPEAGRFVAPMTSQFFRSFPSLFAAGQLLGTKWQLQRADADDVEKIDDSMDPWTLSDADILLHLMTSRPKKRFDPSRATSFSVIMSKLPLHLQLRARAEGPVNLLRRFPSHFIATDRHGHPLEGSQSNKTNDVWFRWLTPSLEATLDAAAGAVPGSTATSAAGSANEGGPSAADVAGPITAGGLSAVPADDAPEPGVVSADELRGVMPAEEATALGVVSGASIG